MFIAYFFGAAAGGFILLAAIGIQALVALFSSIPLTRHHKAENSEFNVKKAYRRIALVTVIVLALVGIVSALVLYYAPVAAKVGYVFGLVLAILCCIKRMSPNNEQNQKNYEDSYADCYPPSAVNPDDVASSFLADTSVEQSAVPGETEDASASDDDVTPAPPPGEQIHWRDMN
ncbi:MAG: hypothetical protein LKJ86_06750 [Oscillibacter sp.]|jgi:hypothetical protein|nr:hypothetical protein [Oscillibacter sp.]